MEQNQKLSQKAKEPTIDSRADGFDLMFDATFRGEEIFLPGWLYL